MWLFLVGIIGFTLYWKYAGASATVALSLSGGVLGLSMRTGNDRLIRLATAFVCRSPHTRLAAWLTISRYSFGAKWDYLRTTESTRMRKQFVYAFDELPRRHDLVQLEHILFELAVLAVEIDAYRNADLSGVHKDFAQLKSEMTCITFDFAAKAARYHGYPVSEYWRDYLVIADAYR